MIHIFNRCRIFLAFIVSLAILSPAFAAEQNSAYRVFGKYYAIIIGISKYKKWPELQTPVKDADEIAHVLNSEYGFTSIEITDNTNPKPTAKDILNTIRDTAATLGENDNLLIYYTGHGQEDKITKEVYWIPIDGELNDPSTWIPSDEITAYLKTNEIKARHIILIADSCYSGSMKGIKQIPPKSGRIWKKLKIDDKMAIFKEVKKEAMLTTREIITSGGDEPVPDSNSGTNNSIFAYYLLKALDENKTKYIGMDTLFNEKVRSSVENLTNQKPQIIPVNSPLENSDGAFILAKATIPDIIPQPPAFDADKELKKDKEKEEQLQMALQEANAKVQEANAKVARLEKEKSETEEKLQETLSRDEEIVKDQDMTQAKLKEEEEKIAEERMANEAEQKKMQDDKEKLSALENTHKADEERLQQFVKEKAESDLDDKERAFIQSEKTKIEAERKQIEEETSKLNDRQNAQSEAEARLKQKDDELLLKEQDNEKKVEQAKKEMAALEEQKKRLEADISRAQDEKRIAEGLKPINPEAIKDRFIVLNGTVIDKKTGLMWLQNADYAMYGRDWDSAMKYVENLKYAGYTDWRLPSKGEWETIVGNETDSKKGIDNTFPSGYPFSNLIMHGSYWSSSFDPLGPNFAYVVNVVNGNIAFSGKNKVGFIWPVRYATQADMDTEKEKKQ